VAVFAAAILCLGAVFLLRSPVILVTDNAFDRIYGGLRGMLIRTETALKLRRPVKKLRLADAAAADMVVFALEAASAKPFCVVFPYRYREGAERYAEKYPERPAVVLTGRIPPPGDGSGDGGGPLCIGTNTAADLYRAGRCAAGFAEGGGVILLLYDEPVSAANREAFDLGLRDGGFSGSPRYINGTAESVIPGDTSCAVITGPADHYFKQNLDIPVILFSWTDPGLTRRSVKVVFDDSPWALAAQAVNMAAGRGAAGEIPSRGAVIRSRIPEKDIFLSLKSAIKADNWGEDLFEGDVTD
jgi:hypothetical protein